VTTIALWQSHTAREHAKAAGRVAHSPSPARRNTVNWRGHRYRLLADGRFKAVEVRAKAAKER
jgi:ribosomal protein L28